MTMSMQLETAAIEIEEFAPGLIEEAPQPSPLAASDLHRMRRLVAVHNHLLDLMADERSAAELLNEVASLLEMPLALFDGQGALLAQAGRVSALGAADRLWRRYLSARRGDALRVVDATDSRLCFHEVAMLGRVERVLVAAVPCSADPELAEMSLAYLERLLALEVVRQREDLLTARRMRGRLLQDFLSSSEPAPDEVARRLEREQIDERSPWRVIVCELSQPRASSAGAGRAMEAETEDRLVAAAERVAAERRLPQLVAVDESALVILAVFAEPELAAVHDFLTALQSALQRALPTMKLHIGCSAEKVGLSRGARALHEAREAIALAARQPSAIELFDRVCGRYRVIEGQSDETLKDIYARTVARLAETDAREHTRLLKTLAVLLDNQLAVQATADALYIHRNTLQKRLHRIERLLEVDLDRLDDVVELYLGLRAGELLGQAS